MARERRRRRGELSRQSQPQGLYTRSAIGTAWYRHTPFAAGEVGDVRRSVSRCIVDWHVVSQDITLQDLEPGGVFGPTAGRPPPGRA